MLTGAPGSGHPGRNDRWWTVAVLLTTVLVKCFFLRVDQVFEAHTMALDLLATGQFGHHYFGSWDRTFQFPVYTALLAAIYGLGGGGQAVLLFQVACGTAVAWFSLRLARLLLKGHPRVRVIGLAVALLVGLDPFLGYYQVRMIHPFAWDMLIALALLYASLTADPGRRWTIFLLFALGGLSLLNRPTLAVFMLPFLFRFPGFLFSLDRLPVKVALVMLLFGPIGCWVLRNHALTGRFQLTSVTDQMIWMGQQEETEGGSYQSDGTTYLHLLSSAERHRMFTEDPVERSELFRAKWQEERAMRPGLAWRMLGMKLKNFWTSRSAIGQDHASGMQWAMDLYRVHAVILFGMFVVSQFLADRRLRFIGLSVMLLSVAQCIYYFETRHRLLVDPILITLAMVVVVRIGERIPRLGSATR